MHNPVALEAIRRARERYASVPHLAVFDTAFRELPAPAATYAIDADLAAREGVRDSAPMASGASTWHPRQRDISTGRSGN